MFTKSLSVSLTISLPIYLILLMRVVFLMKYDGGVEKSEHYSQQLKQHEQSGLIQSLKLL